MNPHSGSHDPDPTTVHAAGWPRALVEQQAFLMRLARSLTTDAHAAADVVQDTLLAASRSSTVPTGSVRAFLVGILRNRAYKAWRGEQRRRRHEQAAARSEAVGAEAEVGEQLETQRQLLEALERLPEPYRTTLVLRYQRDLGPSAIATRTGTSLATVKSRLRRGLEHLREDLDRRCGDRGVWSLALLGFRPSDATAPVPLSLAAGGALVTVKWIVATSSGAVLAALLWTRSGAQPPAAPADAPAAHAEAAEPLTLRLLDVPGAGPAAPPGPAARRAAPATPPPAPDGPAAAVGARGHVYDVEGRPVRDVSLVYRPNLGDPVEVTSGANGSFELPSPVSRGVVVADGDMWWSLCPGVVGAAPDFGTPVLVLAPRTRTEFRVIDTRGDPVPAATISLVLPLGWNSALPIAADQARRPAVWSLTDDEGRYTRDLPVVPGALVQVHGGARFLLAHVDLESLRIPGATVVLEDAPRADVVLEGRVVGPDDAPLAGVRLCLGEREARTDDVGRFALLGERLEPGGTLRALLPGYLPTQLEDPNPAGPGAEAGWPAFVTLRLEPGVHTIAGVVLDEEGRALEGISVLLVDRTHWGTFDRSWTSTEAELGGDRSTTDAEGRFELAGLLEREYELVAVDHDTLWSRRALGVRPGTHDLRLVLRAPSDARTVAGHCVAPDGTPLAGVHVAAALTVQLEQVGAPQRIPFSHGFRTSSVATDDAGRFVLADLPPEVDTLAFESGATLPLELPLLPDGLTEPVVLDRRAPFELEVTGEHASADTYALLDAAGTPLVITTFSGHGSSTCGRCRLEDGRSGIRTAPERAIELVLYDGSDVVHRSPVALAPGEVTRLRVR